uniref:Protein kinase domain-containing protein n=1 Tax=Meloidogyne hapla TaxID=6305 RepID=A0A1I8BGX3_MELHA
MNLKFILLLLNSILPKLIYATRCEFCGKEVRGQLKEIELYLDYPNDHLNQNFDLNTPTNEIILEYDDLMTGSGAYSKVYHATLKEGLIGGKNREQIGCIALKQTIIPEGRERVEQYQQNEWNVLKLFNTLNENQRESIIKLYATAELNYSDRKILYTLLEWGGGRNFKRHISSQHSRQDWKINDDKVFELIKPAVQALRDLHRSIIVYQIVIGDLLAKLRSHQIILTIPRFERGNEASSSQSNQPPNSYEILDWINGYHKSYFDVNQWNNKIIHD